MRTRGSGGPFAATSYNYGRVLAKCASSGVGRWGRLKAMSGLMSEPEASDDELMIRVAAGDESALAMLYDRLGRYAYGLSLRMVRESHAAEDVVQEAFVSLWRNAHRFDPERASVRSWLLTIVRRRAIDAIRKRPASVVREVMEEDAVVDDAFGEVVDSERARLLRGALDTLDPSQRTTLALAYFGGLSQSDIAEVTETPLGTVKSRTRLALVRLRGALAGTLAEGEARA